jgi:hypothetical protein
MIDRPVLDADLVEEGEKLGAAERPWRRLHALTKADPIRYSTVHSGLQPPMERRA